MLLTPHRRKAFRSAAGILDRATLSYWLSKNSTGTALPNSGGTAAGSATFSGVKDLDWNSTDGDYVYFNGNTSEWLELPDHANTRPSGDLTITSKVWSWDWTHTDEQVIFSKDGASDGARSLYTRINLSGQFQSLVYPDGNASSQQTNASTALGLTDQTWQWLRLTRDETNGTNSVYDWYTGGSGASPSWSLDSTDLDVIGGLFNTTSNIRLGRRGYAAADPMWGRMGYVGLYQALDDSGSPFVEFDPALCGATGYLDLECGQRWTFTRAGLDAYNLPLVTRHEIAFAGTDYCYVADHADLDVGSSEDFYVAYYFRHRIQPSSDAILIAKKDNATSNSAGYLIKIDSSNRPVGVIGDGTNVVTITGTALDTHRATLVVLQRNGSNIELIQVSSTQTLSATPVSDTTGSLANADELRFGRLSGAGTSNCDHSLFWAGIEKGAVLTTGQAESLYAEVNTALGGRVGNSPPVGDVTVGGIDYAYIGPEMVNNGTFDSDVSGWSNTGTTTTWGTGGTADVYHVGGVSSTGFNQNVTVTSGALYCVEFTIVSCDAPNEKTVINHGWGIGFDSQLLPGTYRYIGTASSGSQGLKFWPNTAGYTSILDNISVREVVAL